MTMNEATAALQVPAHAVNNNCVQDAQARLREVLKLAGRASAPEAEAPAYVQERVRWLQDWVNHAAKRGEG